MFSSSLVHVTHTLHHRVHIITTHHITIFSLSLVIITHHNIVTSSSRYLSLNHPQGKEVRTAAVIQSNPEQSKHLETARLKISGLWIDLVGLYAPSPPGPFLFPSKSFVSASCGTRSMQFMPGRHGLLNLLAA